MIFQKMTPKWDQEVEVSQHTPCTHEKMRTPSDRASTIMVMQIRLCFKTWIWTGVRGVQRGPDHVEWRTPPVLPEGPPWMPIGRRVLRTMSPPPHPDLTQTIREHEGLPSARRPRHFRVRGGDFRGGFHEFSDFSKS